MLDIFLNGVCRHEPQSYQPPIGLLFLNGVCRHERFSGSTAIMFLFLNGVCRHEPSYITQYT
ncbi:hypothetical protein URS_2217 [Acinetobacter ursingii]|nr:hypothetical protein URS_2217 [Acinetobacter ursingii]